MQPRPIDWVVTIPFLITFGGILLLFDPPQRIARVFGRRPQEIVAAWMQKSLVWAFRLAGTRISVDRSSKVEPNTPYLFISNHQSMFDIPILGALLASNYPKYVSKRELARRLPSISYNLRAGGHAIIDRSDREQATEAIRALAAQVLERRVSAVLFPEGTRAREGELGRFRPAGARALLEAAPGIPVVPIAIDESWRLLRFNLLPVPFGTHIHIHIGDPIPRQTDEDVMALLRESRLDIEKALAGWRAG